MTRVLVEGSATAESVILTEPLSFWGGYDPVEGLVIDRSHPQHGASLAGRVVAMPHSRGSSSSSAVLAEALRLGTGPAGIVLREADQIVVTGVLVARMLYGIECPVVVGEIDGPGIWRIDAGGAVRVS